MNIYLKVLLFLAFYQVSAISTALVSLLIGLDKKTAGWKVGVVCGIAFGFGTAAGVILTLR